MDEMQRQQRAIERRDAAARRVRRLTLGVAVAAAAAAGAIAGVTASAGGVSKKAVRSLLGVETTSSSAAVPWVPEPTPTVTVSQSAAPSAPQSVPSSAGTPPVAVSGGS